MKRNYEIEKNLIISINHVKESSIEFMKNAQYNVLIFHEFDFGYKIGRFVDDPIEPEIPRDIKRLMKIIKKNKLDWLILDMDGPIYPWLKTYGYGDE